VTNFERFLILTPYFYIEGSRGNPAERANIRRLFEPDPGNTGEGKVLSYVPFPER